MTDLNLVNRLLTIAGEMMEDASVGAIVDDGTLAPLARAEAVKTAAANIGVLASAVLIIMAHGPAIFD